MRGLCISALAFVPALSVAGCSDETFFVDILYVVDEALQPRPARVRVRQYEGFPFNEERDERSEAFVGGTSEDDRRGIRLRLADDEESQGFATEIGLETRLGRLVQAQRLFGSIGESRARFVLEFTDACNDVQCLRSERCERGRCVSACAVFGDTASACEPVYEHRYVNAIVGDDRNSCTENAPCRSVSSVLDRFVRPALVVEVHGNDGAGLYDGFRVPPGDYGAGLIIRAQPDTGTPLIWSAADSAIAIGDASSETRAVTLSGLLIAGGAQGIRVERGEGIDITRSERRFGPESGACGRDSGFGLRPYGRLSIPCRSR